ncbi:MAG: hypothetical protein QXF25_02760 [Candidatus Pacearchaeota archaeon]
MKFEHYLKKVLESEIYKNLKQKNSNIYLCTGFFVLDFETGKDIHQLDFVIGKKEIATFSLDNGVKMNISRLPLKKKLPEIKGEIKTDLKALKGIVEDEMKNRTITDSIKKIIALLQIIDGKLVWNLNCITNNLNVLQVHIDDSDQTILKFVKYSIMDFVKTIPNPSSAIGKSGAITKTEEE